MTGMNNDEENMEILEHATKKVLVCMKFLKGRTFRYEQIWKAYDLVRKGIVKRRANAKKL